MTSLQGQRGRFKESGRRGEGRGRKRKDGLLRLLRWRSKEGAKERSGTISFRGSFVPRAAEAAQKRQEQFEQSAAGRAARAQMEINGPNSLQILTKEENLFSSGRWGEDLEGLTHAIPLQACEIPEFCPFHSSQSRSSPCRTGITRSLLSNPPWDPQRQRLSTDSSFHSWEQSEDFDLIFSNYIHHQEASPITAPYISSRPSRSTFSASIFQIGKWKRAAIDLPPDLSFARLVSDGDGTLFPDRRDREERDFEEHETVGSGTEMRERWIDV
nr:F-box/kelch-repeat protein At5g43190 [Ipomoea batatas]